MKNTIEHLSARVAPFFEGNHDILCVYLFGSHVRGTAHRDSDVDLAILFSDNVDPMEYTDRSLDLMRSITALVATETDIIVLNRASTYVKFHVVQKGIKLFDRRDALNRRFEGRAMVEYYDYLPIRTRMEDALIRKIKERAHG